MPPAPPLVDEATVEGVRVGDPDALAAVYEAMVGPLTAWIRSHVRDPETAAELADETFLELIRDCRRITGDGRSVRAWLYRAARRNIIDHYRARSCRPQATDQPVPEVEDPAAEPSDRVASAERLAQIRSLVDELPPDQREVVTLRYLADLSTKEVAEATGRSLVAVRGLAHRGTKALARRLGALGPELAPAPAEVRS